MVPTLESVETPPAEGNWKREVEELADRFRALGSSFENSRKQLTSIRRVLEQINRGQSLEEIAEYLYEAFRGVIPYERMGLALVDADGERVTARWARSETSEIGLPVGYSAPLEGSSLRRVLSTGEPRILHDLEEYLREHPSSESTRRIVQEGIRSSLTCPLRADGRAVGFLFFSSREPGAYRDVHIEVFQQIASSLSLTLEKALLYERLAVVNGKLQEHVRQLGELNERIEYLALTDELTDVANRRALRERLEEEVSLARRHERPLSILMLDLDHFKNVNDTHGHDAGDTVLRETAARLKDTSRTEDVVARFGGEEFVLVLPCTDRQAAAILAERIRRRMGEEPFLDEKVPVTVSIGVAQLRKDDDAESLLGRADERLYRAKDRGRNRVES